MAASALFILDLKGRVILSRDYRGDISPKNIERFISKHSELEETGIAPLVELHPNLHNMEVLQDLLI